MRNINPFASLTRFERRLWLSSVCVVLFSGVLSGGKDLLSVAASLIGVTSLIFLAKGYVLGQVLTVVFSVLYGIISYGFRYYGEMITYLGMTAPMALLAVVSWLRHPFEGSREVEVSRITGKQGAAVLAGAAVATGVFYFILKALSTASLAVSTVSVTTSFLASALTYLRSPLYALSYAANDLILIVLWILAARKNPSCLPMILCFAMFFVNDVYAYVNWRRIHARQCSKKGKNDIAS